MTAPADFDLAPSPEDVAMAAAFVKACSEPSNADKMDYRGEHLAVVEIVRLTIDAAWRIHDRRVACELHAQFPAAVEPGSVPE